MWRIECGWRILACACVDNVGVIYSLNPTDQKDVYTMTPEVRQRVNDLCEKIQAEMDRSKFTKLIDELGSLLDENSQNTSPKLPPKSGSISAAA